MILAALYRPATSLPAACALFAAALALATISPSASAMAAKLPPNFEDWKLLKLPNKEPATFEVSKSGGLQIEAVNAVGFLYAQMETTSPKRLAWRWRVDRDIPATDLSKIGKDDRPLAVHVWFPPKEEDITLGDRLGSLFGYPTIGQVLTYVWGGTAQRGTEMANPHFENSKLIVLRSGSTPTGVWFEEEIDIAADYQMAFGAPPPAKAYIAISADTDDAGGTSVAQLDNLELRASKPAPATLVPGNGQ